MFLTTHLHKFFNFLKRYSILKKYLSILTSVVLIVLLYSFIAKGVYILDPDFGWHYKLGEIIAVTGIPETDPFSYTMPSFPFIAHEWLTSYFIFRLLDKSGFVGLSIISAFFVFIALSLSLLRLPGSKFGYNLFSEYDQIFSKKSFFIGPITLLGLASLLPFAGVRPQVQSWMLYSLLLLLIFKKNIYAKFKYLIPLLVVLWVNLHGSFAIAVVTLVFVFAIRWFRFKKIKTGDIYIILLSILATFINPYGPNIWKEVLMTITDASLRWNIAEWRPALFRTDFAFWIYLCFSVVLVIKNYKILKPEELLLYLAVLSQALLSSRHIPLWIIVSLPITIKSTNQFFKEVGNIKYGRKRFTKAFLIFGVISYLIFLHNFYRFISGMGPESNSIFYPEGAVAYLKENSTENRYFTVYEWGGYLIWNYPEKKVFIDGRMPSWRWDKNPTSESAYAFDDYINILTGKLDYAGQFDKYNIDTALIPPINKNTVKFSISEKHIDDFLNKYFGREKNDFSINEKLEEDRWEIVYKDSTAIIYRKTDN